MHIESYGSLLAGHPHLERCLRMLIGPQAIQQGSHPDFTFQGWVERFVSGIEILPANQISLAEVNVGAITHPARSRFVVFYHIEYPGTPEVFGGRVVYQADGGFTLAQTLGGLKTIHRAALADNPRAEIVIDLVVRHSTLRANIPQSYYNEEFDLFLPDDKTSRYWLDQCPAGEPPVTPFLSTGSHVKARGTTGNR